MLAEVENFFNRGIIYSEFLSVIPRLVSGSTRDFLLFASGKLVVHSTFPKHSPLGRGSGAARECYKTIDYRFSSSVTESQREPLAVGEVFMQYPRFCFFLLLRSHGADDEWFTFLRSTRPVCRMIGISAGKNF